WHGVCAAILARTEWGVTDEAVLSAVACHTAGKPGMTLLDKILFLADMTSAERDFDGVESLRRLAFEDIDRAMLAALNESVSFVKHGASPWTPCPPPRGTILPGCWPPGRADKRGLP